MLLTLRHLGGSNIYFIQHPVPHILRCDGDPTVDKFYGDLGENSPTYFSPPYIYRSKILAIPFLHLQLSRTNPRSPSILS